MEKKSKIYIAGSGGLVGSAIVRKLHADKYENILEKTSKDMDLRNYLAVESFFAAEKPEYVFLAAAKVGGIYANATQPAEFIYDNLLIAANIIHAAHKFNVRKLLFLGSSCIYPKFSSQPMKEEYLLTGELEPTNEPYAIAKIAGIKMCQAYRQQYGSNFIAVMPTNLYGINDNFDLLTSHVLPALIRKFHEAAQSRQEVVTVWGSGNPRREFLYVDDLADACVFLMNNYDQGDIINIGTGTDVSITGLAKLIAHITGFSGQVVYDQSKPDGTPVKLLDVSKLANMGWTAKTSLQEGITKTYEWFCKNKSLYSD